MIAKCHCTCTKNALFFSIKSPSQSLQRFIIACVSLRGEYLQVTGEPRPPHDEGDYRDSVLKNPAFMSRNLKFPTLTWHIHKRTTTLLPMGNIPHRTITDYMGSIRKRTIKRLSMGGNPQRIVSQKRLCMGDNPQSTIAQLSMGDIPHKIIVQLSVRDIPQRINTVVHGRYSPQDNNTSVHERYSTQDNKTAVHEIYSPQDNNTAVRERYIFPKGQLHSCPWEISLFPKGQQRCCS